MHHVAVLARPGVIPSDLATPIDLFRHALNADNESLYRVTVCAERPTVDAGPFRIHTHATLTALRSADTIVVPGVHDPLSPASRAVRDALTTAHGRGARVVSVCTGAFLLAECGLCTGLRVTTHWQAARELALRHPDILVTPDVLFTDEGSIATSAGAAAAHDLVLHLIQRDFGTTVAARTARAAVMPLWRDGGQAQFIEWRAPQLEGELQVVLRWLDAHHMQALTLQSIADAAHMSRRTLSRRFKRQLGTTPMEWLSRTRINRAQRLLEATDLSVERIAEEVGFGSTVSFRQHFRRITQRTPSQWKRQFGEQDWHKKS